MSHIRLYKQTENGLQFINICRTTHTGASCNLQDHEKRRKSTHKLFDKLQKQKVEYAETETRKRAARTGVSILNQVMPSFAEVLKQRKFNDKRR